MKALHIWNLALFLSLLSLLSLPGLPAPAFGQTPKPLKPATIGLLYTDDTDPVSGKRGFVTNIAAWRSYLYAAWHDLDQRYYLHIWDMQNPAMPVQLASIYFGQGVDTPSLRFEPKGLSVRNGHLVMNVDNKLRVYPLKADGSLDQPSEYDFDDGLDSKVSVLRHGGEFASILRTTISNDDFLDAISGPSGVPASTLEQYLSANVFVNLRNPKAPFLQRKRRPYGYGYESHDQAISGSYRGNPYIAELSDDNTSLVLTTFSEKNDDRLTGFWEEKLSFLFKSATLNKTLGAITRKVIREMRSKQLQAKLLDQYFKSLRVDLGKSIAARLRAKWPATTTIASILAEYGLDEQDSLTRVLTVLLERQLSSATQTALVRRVYAKALAAFHDQLFAIKNKPLAQVSLVVAAKMNESASAADAPSYFVTKIISPLLGNPAYLEYTVEDALAAITSSALGQAIDGFLGTFHSVLPVSDFLTAPGCFQIPNSTRSFLENFFVENGPKLSLNGLAAYELIRLALYYSGADTSSLEGTLRSQIQSLHSSLSSDLVRSVYGSVGAIADLEIEQLSLIKSVAANAGVSDVVVDPIVGALAALLSRQGIDISQPIGELFETQGLYLEPSSVPFGEEQATVALLVAKVNQLGLGRTRLAALAKKAKARQPLALEATIEALLIQQYRDIFGEVGFSSTLKAAVYELLRKKLDPSIPGDFVSDTLHTLLKSQLGTFSADPADAFSLTGLLGDVSLAARGDCVSSWKLALEGAALLAQGSLLGSGLSPLFLAAEEALHLAAESSISALLKVLVGELTESVLVDNKKDYRSWYAALEASTEQISLREFRPDSLELAKVVSAGDKLAVVMYDQGFFSVAEPTVYMALLEHTDGVLKSSTIEVGQWSEIHGISSSGNFVLIDGDLLQEGQSSHQLKIIDTRGAVPVQHLVADPQLEILYQLKEVVPLNNGQHLAARLDAPSEVLLIDLY